MNYQEFLETKKKTFIESGFDIDESQLNKNLKRCLIKREKKY
jgi:hypothetical protein